MPSIKVFIQANRKQELGALLSRYSILKQSPSLRPEDVVIMMVEDIPLLISKHGQTYLRNGHQAVWSKEDLQSFTMTRFLPPQLMGYQGRALVIDPDVFALPGADVSLLANLEMGDHSMFACRDANGKFKSSVMLLDCSRLRHWKWDEDVERIFSKERDYRQWASLQLEPAGSIGVLPDFWNHCDTLTAETKFIHYTRRITQPWKTGLPVDFQYDSLSAKFGFIPRSLIDWSKGVMGKGSKRHKTYQPNPYADQVRFFFDVTQNALRDGAVSLEQIKDQVFKGYLRSDMISHLQAKV